MTGAPVESKRCPKTPRSARSCSHPRPRRQRAGPRPLPGDYLIYFGALQPWQGVDDLIRAFALLRDAYR